ncbi:MAG: GNAT family N-acetyltransferase [Gemmatimonadaceae bacterium]|jgi:aminoglycoside 3-N-acetyltransferase I|nr:GNAT family N-acetyltransferase [Gemmatimonadaceae bacterium]
MAPLSIRRLGAADRAPARTLFALFARVFETDAQVLSDDALELRLRDPAFWALAAYDGDTIVGGLTAHTLPMTRDASHEILIYDLAVDPAHQRTGVARATVDTLRALARADGIEVVLVMADNEDTHALDFYRAVGGTPHPVTLFVFGDDATDDDQ